MTNNPLEFFKKIYCINLDERPDRWQYCVSEFDKLGVTSYERFSALKVDKLPNGQPGNNKAGHTRTYCAVVDKAIADEVETCIIFEDDFRFLVRGDALTDGLNCAVSQLPEDWDLLYFGATLCADYLAEPIQKYSSCLFKLNSAYATHAIAFSRKGLQALRNQFSASADWYLEYLKKSAPADIFLARDFLPKHNAYITSSLLCDQLPGTSDILGYSVDYSRLIRERFAHYKAKLK